MDFFTSTKVVMGLFALLICFLIPLTFFTEFAPVLLQPVKIILAIIGLDLVVCTLRKFKTLRRSTLVIHLGAIVILTGGLISTFGFVATINIYEGSSTETVFRWDVDHDVPLGFELLVPKINMDFYPVPVKVGVLKNGKKADLFVTRTGDSFVLEGYRVQILALQPIKEELQLAVQSLDGQPVGTATTSGRKDLPTDFPFDFKLVAFQDPVVKRMWVNLELQKDGEMITSGISEVNNPLRWQGMQFFLTQIAADKAGRAYAGIQVSRDPGVPFVYGGFVILFLGLLMALRRWVTAGRKLSAGSFSNQSKV